MEVIAIVKQNLNSYQGTSSIVGLAKDIECAKDWITLEVTKPYYAQGHTDEWWIKQGYFVLKPMEVFGS